ncbi:nuclear transport factor 2 family protein [Massilia sp. IC2-477]|uniref:nuclear transport factor 2 family protein n=1 Tax=Massilia sp. IC2-477 TaxID=2887198 RepID=UPI001D1181E1|nr:nuclear transport factor 2 family protein [Massilia sp. IC2-477]MCC2955261.1 nuclear transport factor 2 family protein [Massilia sp. IC2-477]
MRLLSIVTFCLAALSWQAAPAAASDAPVGLAAGSVREAERQRTVALNGRDIELLRRLISGNYRHVETNGRLRTKTEFLQALARDEYRIRNYEVEDMDIELLEDGGVAVVTGTYRATRADLGGQPLRGRYVRVWIRQPEGWRMSLHQGTEIRPAASYSAGGDPRALQ